jgi:hypothetical protein
MQSNNNDLLLLIWWYLGDSLLKNFFDMHPGCYVLTEINQGFCQYVPSRTLIKEATPLAPREIHDPNMLQPKLTKRIRANQKYALLTTIVPEYYYSSVSRSWDAIL